MVKGMINEVLEIKLIVEHGTECDNLLAPQEKIPNLINKKERWKRKSNNQYLLDYVCGSCEIFN